uniref:RNA-directed RNA polymerase catalytic subunit n=1 Tax=Wenling orthomyxo-like virus 1 TaxID=2116455 RepID=A0A2P1GNL4_9ORTO|nr:PB1 [Wenling orthomyxo-like virus 1]
MFMTTLNTSDLERMLTHTYMYAAAAPVRTGTPTRKILDTCYRTVTYSKFEKPEDYAIHTPLNVNTISHTTENIARVDLKLFRDQARIRFGQYGARLKRQFQRWSDYLRKTSASSLCSGRQTYDPILERNIPAPQAYEAYVRLLKENLGRDIPDSMWHLIESTTSLMAQDKVTIPGHWSNSKNQAVYDYDDEDDEEEMDYLRSFYEKAPKLPRGTHNSTRVMSSREFLSKCCVLSAFIKQAERGQLESRAIASPSMLFRSLIVPLEELNGYILEMLGSAVAMSSVGKMSTMLSMTDHKANIFGLVGDNAKWNETISVPAVCTILHECLLISELPSEDLTRYLESCMTLFTKKSVRIGGGLSLKNTLGAYAVYSLLDCHDILKTTPLKEHIEILQPYFSVDFKTVRLPSGMLMGMLNKGSTLQGLLGTYHNEDFAKLQSSDDFIAVYESRQTDPVMQIKDAAFTLACVSLLERFYGTNDSINKCYAIQKGDYLEYNSLWRTGDYLANLGVELSGLMIQGRNPVDDYTNLIKAIREICAKGAIEPCIIPICLGVMLRTYRLNYFAYPDRRPGEKYRTHAVAELLDKYGGKVLPWHGGPCPHTTTTLSCETVTLALQRGMVDEEYLQRSLNPLNPIHYTLSETELVSFDSGKRLRSEDSWGPNVCKWRWRDNRSFLSSYAGVKQSLHCREIANAYRATTIIAPDLTRYQTRTGPVGQYLAERLRQEAFELLQTTSLEEEKQEIVLWINSLSNDIGQ